MMLSDGIRHIGDGLLELSEERLKGILATEVIEDIYEVEQTPFARGKFATVRRATNKKTGVNFAAKFLKRRRRGQNLSKDIGHEIAVLLLCADSRNIVKLHGVHETKTETALLLEMATGGELQAMIDEEGALTEEQTRICMKEILAAIQFLHKKQIAHLDLKPQNILLAGEKIQDGLKLCDFGISRVVEEGGKIREILGTPDYVAPEVLQYEPLSLQTDIWSVGVLTYVLLTGCSPFGGDTKQETFLNISKCALTFPEELFDDISSLAIDFIRCALKIKPQDRMTVSECLEHRWLTNEIPLLHTVNEKECVKDEDEENIEIEDDVDDENICSSSNSSTTSSLTPTNLDRDSDEGDDDEFIENNEQNKLQKTNGILLSNHGNKNNNNNNNNNHCNINSNNSCSNNSLSCCKFSKQNLSKFSKNNQSILCNQQQQQQQQESRENRLCDEDKENMLVTNYSCNTRELNLIIEENKDENKLICEKLTNSSATTSSNTSLSQQNGCSTSTQSTITTTTTINLFPDAPTTPKVSRKECSSSPSIVKQLVKQFQMESLNHSNRDVNKSSTIVTVNTNHTNSSTSSSSSSVGTITKLTKEQNNGISTSATSTTTTSTSDPICRQLEKCNRSGKLCIDQGIIC